MLRTLAVIVGVVVLLVAGALAVAATRPDTFRVQRALDIQAPPEKIYPLLADLRRSVEWSPYEKKDPDMKRVYRGADSGKGAIYEWDGNKNIGAGSLEIADVSPPTKVVLKLNMVRPFTANNIVEYTLTPNGGATRVSWDMHGPNPYPAKVMQVFFDVDKMVGRDFEEGLASLKALAEK
ncbi:MAG: SRPBCC family protein [Bradyrhizobiaceae bacterium]|nr:SRPBCC family protein [Bradyrhizobiaceae bacterium]